MAVSISYPLARPAALLLSYQAALRGFAQFPAPLCASATRAVTTHAVPALIAGSASLRAADVAAGVPSAGQSTALPFAARAGNESTRCTVHTKAGKGQTTGDAAPLPRVGFLGVGIMGAAMAANLVKAGYPVTVWNRREEKMQPLVDAGATPASSAAAVTAACDVTFAMLSDPQAALSVACGPNGAVEGLSSGKGYVDASTVDADTSVKVAAAVRSKGALYLEAPVSGSKKPAIDGTLIFLTAGDKQLYDTVAPMLDVMGKSKFFLGTEGKAAAMKLVVNCIMGSTMAAFAEGIALGEQVGLDPHTILQVIGQGAISSPMFSLKGPLMLARDFAPAFPLRHQQKDLRLALALGDEVAQALPVAAAANEVYKKARAEGLSDADFSAVIQALRQQKEGDK